MTLTKAEIAAKLSKEDLPRKAAGQMMDHVFEIIKAKLAEGESVLLSGFGKFEVKEKRPRKGRNPRTGESVEIEARRVVIFRPSTRLRKRIDKSEDEE